MCRHRSEVVCAYPVVVNICNALFIVHCMQGVYITKYSSTLYKGMISTAVHHYHICAYNFSADL